jgi:hypothetical protein
MSGGGPFIFIATNRLRPGRLEEERERFPGLCEFVQAHEPRLIAFNEYANDEGTEVGVVQVHPDVESMVFHLKLIGERAAEAYARTIEATTSIQVFGTPNGAVRELLGRQAGDVALSVKPHHIGGFVRPGAP